MRTDSDEPGGANGASPGRVQVPDRVRGGAGLTRGMRAATAALAEVLFWSDGPPPPARVAWLCDELDVHLEQSSRRLRWTYRGCLLAVSLLAPLFAWRPPPLAWLGHRSRALALERMERNALLGLPVFGAKAVLCILYYEHPDAARSIGHDGGCALDATP